jgi:ABC-type glycerol-3-phosphate transport system permease component
MRIRPQLSTYSPRATAAAALRSLFGGRVTAGTLIHYGLLILLVFLSFFVILVMISMSLRPTPLIYADFWALPFPPTFENYRTAVFDLIPAMFRTLVITLTSIAGVLVFACPAAYALARTRFLGRGFINYVILAVMMIPGVILLTPHFIMANQLGLRGSLLGLVFFYVAGGQPFAIFLITTFFKSQAEEIFESARIDGASEFQSLRYIAIPLARPILVTIAVLTFLGLYDDYIWPSLMLSQSNQTLILALERYNPATGMFTSRPDLGSQTAAFVFATIPQLILFTVGLKYFVQGLTSGAVKG